MYKKILAISVMSVFVFSFVVAGVSAQTRVENRAKETAKKIEKKVERKITNRMATSTNATSTSSFASSRASSASTTDVSCIKTAVEAREGKIIENQTNFSSEMKTVLETRKNALISAWGVTDAKNRKTDIKSAWNNFKTSSKVLTKAIKENNKSAWSTFEASRKACKGSASTAGLAEENEGKGIDTSVSN